jgi:hypothetical protein
MKNVELVMEIMKVFDVICSYRRYFSLMYVLSNIFYLFPIKVVEIHSCMVV